MLGIRPAPQVENGPGRVVTGTFTHVNDNLHVLRFVGSGATLEATGVHRFYSLDRNDWVAAQELYPSERLQTLGGEVVVAAVERSGEAQRVYNIEVEGEHEYVVGELGVRTHNSYGGSAPGPVARIDPAKFDYLFGRAKGAKNAVHNAPRTAQNLQQMRRLGVPDDARGRTLLQRHFDGVVADPSTVASSYSNKYGKFETRESLFAGPGGFAKFESTWEIMEDGTRRLTTVIPRGGR